MRVVRVNSVREFEAEGEMELGTFVIVGDVISISSQVYQQEDEISKYLGKADAEKIRKFMPDLSEPKIYTKFYALMSSDGSEPLRMVRIGDEVRVMDRAEIIEIHTSNDGVRIPYLPFLMRKDRELARNIVKRLIELIPDHRDIFEMILIEIEYSLLREVDI